MSTLLLRLAAPLQSWGVASKFNTRDTAREPTKSGVIGLLAAALGRKRTERLDDLIKLRFGVRIDQAGKLLVDFHTARLNEKEPPFLTKRHYLADAVFLVGLEGEDSFLQTISESLYSPVFPLFLGRRSCPPVGPLVIGIRDKGLRKALEEESWLASEWYKRKNRREQIKLTIICDAQPDEPGAFLRRDLPISFDQRHRQYGFRMVRDVPEAIPVPTIAPNTNELPTDHDAMGGLGAK